MKPGPRAKFLLKLAVSAGLAIYLARVISWRQVGTALLDTHPVWIAAGYAQMLAMFYLQALRWKLMLRIPGLPVMKYLHFIFVGLFYRVILPGSLSADMLKVVLFGKKYNKPLHESGLIFFSQLLGMLLQWGMGIIGLFYFGRPLLAGVVGQAELSWRKLAILGAAALAAAFAVPFVPAVRRFAVRMLQAVREAMATPGVLSRVIGVTVGIQLLTIGSAYCIFWGVGVQIPLLFLCFQMALAITLSALPLSINGLGLVEYLNLFLLQKTLGEPAAAIIAVSVVSYSLLVLNALLGGAWMLFRNLAAAPAAQPPRNPT
jgi:uncharacterized membrane protein YbhN (UPF0104 family)